VDVPDPSLRMNTTFFHQNHLPVPSSVAIVS
jgi:hypothetical protein